MVKVRLSFLLSGILSGILCIYHVQGFDGNPTDICANYNEKCDPSNLLPCCNINLSCKLRSTNFEHVCEKRAVLDQACRKNEDCGGIKFSMCSSDQKCVCRDNYVEIDGKQCTPLLGKHCLKDNECFSQNLVCIVNECSCRSGVTVKLDDKCFPTQIGFSCDQNEDCFLIPNSKCSDQRCICQSGYIERNNTCAPLLGRYCSQNEKCAVSISVCVNNICQCDKNYIEQSNEHCMPITLTKTCSNSDECPKFSFCAFDGLCKCQPNYFSVNDNVCAPSLGDSCTESKICAVNNSICDRDICQCGPNYVDHLNVTCKLDYFDKACRKNVDCLAINHAVCGDDQRCVCNHGYTKFNNTLCAPLLKEYCLKDKDCFVKNTICQSNECKCTPNYLTISNYKCKPLILGTRCQFNQDCHLIINSECSSDNICICKAKHAVVNEYCKPIIGGYCTSSYECYSNSMKCINNECQCEKNFTAISASLCVISNLLYSCENLSECSDSWHFNCSTDGKCVCQSNNTAITHSTCLPTLGGLCWKDDQCTVDKSLCIDYRCACRSDHTAAANNLCVFIN